MAQIILFNPSNGYLMNKVDIWPPWALIYTSAKLSKEYSIKIIDGRFENWKDILKEELDENTLCVGVTSMTGLQLKYASEFLEEVKKINKNVKTVMGGNHVTSIPEQSIKEPLLDFVVVGDGDTSFYNLVKAIDKKSDFRKVNGIYFKDKDGNTVITPRQEFEDLDDLGELPLNLIDVEKYITLDKGRRKFVIFSSRGCPFGCYYCFNSNKFNNGKWRASSSENTFNFVKLLVEKYNIEHIMFQDDNFWIDKERVMKFVSLIETLKIKWSVYGATTMSLTYITPEFAKKLKDSGLEILMCGIESVSPKIQKVINKYIPLADLYRVNKIMGDVGIKIIYSFMSGFPTETDEDIAMNLEAMAELKKQNPNIDVGNIKPVIYYPGTKLFDWAVENGFKPPKTFMGWSEYSWNNYIDLEYPWIDNKRKELLLNLYFTTLLLNPKYEYIQSKLWKTFSTLLFPITRWRIDHLYFKNSPILFGLRLLKKAKFI